MNAAGDAEGWRGVSADIRFVYLWDNRYCFDFDEPLGAYESADDYEGAHWWRGGVDVGVADLTNHSCTAVALVT